MVKSKEDVLKLLKEKQHRWDTTRLMRYSPYKYQSNFHREGEDCPQRILMAANRVGKTYCGAAETAYHLTGEYPSWWEGRKFKNLSELGQRESLTIPPEISYRRNYLATRKTRIKRYRSYTAKQNSRNR